MKQRQLPTQQQQSPSLNGTYGNYLVDNDSIYRIDPETGEEKWIGNSVYIKNVKQDLLTNKVVLTLRYKYFDKWLEKEVMRSDIRARKIQELSEYGIDVNSMNAKDIEYFLVLQEKRAPYFYTYEYLGWSIFEEKIVFAHHELIGASLGSRVSEYTGKMDVTQAGSLAKYIKILEKYVFGHIAFEFILALGFASIIASLLSFQKTPLLLFIHCYGESSKGKTTSSRLLASIFGKASITEDGLIRTWDTTEKALTTQFGQNHGIPMILDEASSKEAKYDFSKVIYQLAQGLDTQRLTTDLKTMHRNSWSGVLYSTAEHSLTQKANQNSGLKVRVFELGHVEWTKSKEHAEKLNRLLEENYGWLVKPFVEFILNKNTEEIQQMIDKYSKTLTNTVEKPDAFTGRIMEKLAYVITGAVYANECFGFSLDLDAIQSFILEQEQQNMPQRNRAETAYEYIQSQLTQFDHQLINTQTGHHPQGVTIGKITARDTAVMKDVVDKWLIEKGYNDPVAVMSELKNKGYLSFERGHNTRKRKIYDNEVTVYVFVK